MKDAILFSPKEGTTGFRGMRGYPEEPYNDPTFSESTWMRIFNKWNDDLESCKSNSLEIVNPEVMGFDQTYFLPKSGDIFDLPEGYEFKDGCTNFVCEAEGKCECSGKRVLRLVKTEEETTKAKMTNPTDVNYDEKRKKQ